MFFVTLLDEPFNINKLMSGVCFLLLPFQLLVIPFTRDLVVC
jgi:hypothetical protein